MLASAVYFQGKEIQGTGFGKKNTKLSLFADDMIIYMENPKASTNKLLALTKGDGFKVKFICILYISKNQKISILKRHSKIATKL